MIRINEESGHLYDYKDRAVVYSDGTKSLLSVRDTMVRCPVYGDIINCTLRYGSWTHDGFNLNLTSLRDKVDLTSYDTGYEIISNKVMRQEFKYPCCPEPYYDVTINLALKCPGVGSAGTKHATNLLTIAVMIIMSLIMMC